MADREKVITALEFCSDTKTVETCFGKCPYAVADDDYRCRDMKLDALKLLKEQEAEIRQLRLALDIAKGTCKGIVIEGKSADEILMEEMDADPLG